MAGAGRVGLVLVLQAALLVPDAAHAAAGGHIVDDAAVETAGDCNASGFVQQLDGRTRDHGLGMVCTPLQLPFLELGAGLGWSSAGSDISIDPAAKLVLHQWEGGIAIALGGTFSFGLESGRIEAARLVVPVTFELSDAVELNLNAGLAHRFDVALAGTFGAQLVAAVAPALSLMGEAFVETGGKPGVQAGLRFTPGAGIADFDLYVGHRLVDESDLSVGIGMIVRF